MIKSLKEKEFESSFKFLYENYSEEYVEELRMKLFNAKKFISEILDIVEGNVDYLFSHMKRYEVSAEELINACGDSPYINSIREADFDDILRCLYEKSYKNALEELDLEDYVDFTESIGDVDFCGPECWIDIRLESHNTPITVITDFNTDGQQTRWVNAENYQELLSALKKRASIEKANDNTDWSPDDEYEED